MPSHYALMRFRHTLFGHGADYQRIVARSDKGSEFIIEICKCHVATHTWVMSYQPWEGVSR